MAEAGRWKPYVQGQGQLLPAFVDDALDPAGEWNLVSAACNLRRLCALRGAPA